MATKKIFKRSPVEKVTKKASEIMGISVEEARFASCEWHEETRYCDGGFDFTQAFENPRTGERVVVKYDHVSDTCII